MLMNISVAATPYLAAPFISEDPGEIERAMGGQPIQLIGWRVRTQKRQANGSASLRERERVQYAHRMTRKFLLPVHFLAFCFALFDSSRFFFKILDQFHSQRKVLKKEKEKFHATGASEAERAAALALKLCAWCCFIWTKVTFFLARVTCLSPIFCASIRLQTI
jgi:hypothetical protein